MNRDVENDLQKKAKQVLRLDVASLAAVVSLFIYIHGFVLPRTEVEPIKEDIRRNSEAIEFIRTNIKTDISSHIDSSMTLVTDTMNKRLDIIDSNILELSKRIDRLIEKKYALKTDE